MSFRIPSFRGVLKWPPAPSVIIATSGLVIAVAALSHRMWRGGGKKAIDPDGKSRENIDCDFENLYAERKSSDGKITPKELNGQGILKPKGKQESQTVAEVTTENKACGFVEKPNSPFEVEKETEEAISAEIQSIVFVENCLTQPKGAEEEKSEVTILKEANLPEGKPLAQRLVPENKLKAENKEKSTISAENPEVQTKALKETESKALSVKESVVSGEKLKSQQEEAVTLENKKTSLFIPNESGDSFFNEVREIVTERPPNGKTVVEIETLKHELCCRVGDQILDDKVDDSNNSVYEVNEECASSTETLSTTIDSRKCEPSLSSGNEDNCSDLSSNSDPRKEQLEEFCQRENSVSLSEFILEKPSSENLLAAGVAVISCSKTLGKSLETEISANNPVSESQNLKSISISLPKEEETVKGENSVISDSVEPLFVQVVSLDSVNCANQKLEDCSSSPDAVKKPGKGVDPGNSELGESVKAQLCESYSNDNADRLPEDNSTLSFRDRQASEKQDAVNSGGRKLEITSWKSRNNSESDDKQLTEEPVKVPSSVGGPLGDLKHIPSTLGEPESAKEHLSSISHTFPKTERSVDVLSEEGEGKETIKVTLGGAITKDSESAKEHLSSISHTFPKTERSVDVLSEGGEGKETIKVTIGGAITKDSGEAPLKEGLTLKEKEVGGVLSSGKEEKAVEVTPVVKDLSKTHERDDSILDWTMPCEETLEESRNSEVTSSPAEDRSVLTKGVEINSDMVQKGKSGKRKGKKVKGKVLHEDEVVKMVKKMEVNDIVQEREEESVLQNGDVGEDGGKSSQVHASGISSPSIPNFPDNRSEGSSCGDSGKGRSDVTTPGGLEEDLREVSFSHHFSPPCSTSGPEEEEEDRVRRDSGSTVEDGSHAESGSAIGGEDIIGASPVVVASDGLVMPVALPVYPGMVPITPPPSVYEFVIPQGLVGRLIGKHGSFVNLIKARTSATIFIKTHPETNKLKVCAIEGTDEEIQAALDMIREKFPLRRYSSMTLEQVFFLPLPPPTFTLIPDSLPLQLVEGVSNDVILSALVSPSHYFLQQPTHPTYPTLAKLDMWMAMCYQDANAPLLPDVKAGIICAAPTMGGWYRAQIVAVEELPSPPEDESAEEGELIKWCDVRFVDYGGYERLPSHSLRQIRSDFMTLPFQASECYLASVVPAPTSDENKMADGWSSGAYDLVEELTQAQVLKAQVVGHAPDGLPLVLLYAFSHSYGQVVQVNEELVNKGLALWAVPVVETDEALLTNGTEIVSGDENPVEDEPEAIAA